jgi:hypothetical protein
MGAEHCRHCRARRHHCRAGCADESALRSLQRLAGTDRLGGRRSHSTWTAARRGDSGQRFAARRLDSVGQRSPWNQVVPWPIRRGHTAGGVLDAPPASRSSPDADSPKDPSVRAAHARSDRDTSRETGDTPAPYLPDRLAGYGAIWRRADQARRHCTVRYRGTSEDSASANWSKTKPLLRRAFR